MSFVAVIGGGEWGRALASVAHRAGSKVLLVSRRKDAALDAAIEQTRDIENAPKHARLVVLAVPSDYAGEVCDKLAPNLDGSHYVVHGVRGLVGTELKTVSDVVRERTAARRVGALGGPAVASELLEGKPNVVVCASRFPEVCDVFRDAFASSTDLLGLEWASALVGCLMIAVGFAQGTKMTPGLIAAFVSRSIGEASRITVSRATAISWRRRARPRAPRCCSARRSRRASHSTRRSRK
jgi:glycerol-3-phosphate dehydrogenase (NAD(P)+)